MRVWVLTGSLGNLTSGQEVSAWGKRPEEGDCVQVEISSNRVTAGDPGCTAKLGRGKKGSLTQKDGYMVLTES